MHLLDFTLYGFGQFLQILLWIFLPVFILSLLVTTYLNYRKKIGPASQFQAASTAGFHQSSAAAGPAIFYASDESSSLTTDLPPAPDAHTQAPRSAEEDPQDYSDNPYKGFLWMKNKYEEDRMMADTKYEQLKTDFRRSEERMAILMAEQAVLRDLLEKKDLRIVFLQSQLNDRQSWIDGQNERSQQEKTRYEELVTKLEFSSQLLLKIHKELDLSKGLNPAIPGEPYPSSGILAGEVIPTGEDIRINEEQTLSAKEERTPKARSLPETKIVSWIESDSA